MGGDCLSSRPGGAASDQPRQQPQEESSSSEVSQRNAGTETYTGQRVLVTVVPPPERTARSGKKDDRDAPLFQELFPQPLRPLHLWL